MFHRKAILVSTAATIMTYACPAFAQNVPNVDRAGADQTGAGEREQVQPADIVVTARKRSERLQDVPLTVSVVTSATLEAAQIRDGFGLAQQTAGFTYESTGVQANNKPVIRGVTTNSTTPDQQKNSSFIDGLYIAGSTTPPPFLDIERVEILKGPQSTAFGRATFSGAINYVTKDPGDRLSGRIEASAAGLGEYEAGALIGGPLIGDKLKGQITGYYRSFDGNDEWRNSDGRKLGTEETTYASAKLIADPSESIRLELRYAYLQLKNGPNPFLYLDPGASSAANPGQRNTRFTRPDGTFTFYPTGKLPFSTRPYNEDFSTVLNPGTTIDKHRFSGELTIDAFNDHTISVTAGYNTDDTKDASGDPTNRRCYQAGSSTNSLLTISCAETNQKYRDWQVDAKIASSSANPLQYLLGLYLLNYKQDYVITQPVTGATFSTLPAERIHNFSVYGSASYTFAKVFRLGAELRYNIDDTKYIGSGSCGLPTNGQVRPRGTPCTASFRGSATPVAIGDPYTGQVFATDVAKRTFERALYRFTADLKVTPNLLIYAVASKGNQPGRFNVGLPPAFDNFRVVEEEILKNYEIGIKSTFLGGRGTLNIAAYTMDWDNQTFRRTLQLLFLANGSVTEYDPSTPVPAGATTAVGTAVINAGKTRIRGIEGELSLRPFQGLDISSTVAYTDARYVSFCSEPFYQLTGIESVPGGRCRNIDGNRLEAQPAVTASFGAGYSTPIGDGGWSAFTRGDYFYQGRKYESEMNLAYLAPTNIVNARIGVRRGGLSIEAFVNNLTNERTPSRANRLTDGSIPTVAVGSVISTPVTPALVGLSNQNSIAYTPRRSRQFGVRTSFAF